VAAGNVPQSACVPVANLVGNGCSALQAQTWRGALRLFLIAQRVNKGPSARFEPSPERDDIALSVESSLV
jgi:hypothetical protein